MAPVFIHESAIAESDSIGSGTKVWAFAHVLAGAQIGTNCNIGDHAFVETGARVGNNVTIKNNVCIWEGVTVEDDCFLGPHVVFTNDEFPRSPRMKEAAQRYESKQNWLKRTIVERGCSIGANAVILPGIRLGAYSMIAAGATVTHDVPPHALMIGSPARQVGIVCWCGRKVEDLQEDDRCPECKSLLNDLIACRRVSVE